MPFIQLEGATMRAEQKKRLIESFTKSASEILNMDPSAFYVLIKENPLDNWGVGGKVLSEMTEKK